MVSIDVQPASMQFFYFDSSSYRYHSNNLPGTSLTTTFDYSNMRLYPGTQGYSTSANWCSFNGNMRDLFLYYGIAINSYIKDFRTLRNFFRQPDNPFMHYSMTIDDQIQPNEITT